jgi:hypothetical protein
MAWSALRSIRGRKPSVSLPWQIAALIAGTPVLALLMRSGPAALGQDSAAQFFDLGYAFLGSAHRFGPALEAPFPRIAVRLLTLGLFALGWFGRGKVPTAPATSTTEPVRPHFLSVSLTAGATIAALGWLAPLSPHVDRETILFLALLPLGIGMATRWIDRVLGWIPYAWTPREPPLDLVLGIVPIVLVGIVGELLGIRFATGTVVFLPYLLIGVANGVAALARARVPRAIPVAALILVQIASLRFHGQATVDDVDYRGLAQAMAPTVRADDLVLASDAPRARPLLQGASLPPDHFVLRDQDSVLRARPGCRAWVILFDDPEDVPLLDVVRGYRSVLEVRAHGVRAILFELPRRLSPAPGPGEIAPPLG